MTSARGRCEGDEKSSGELINYCVVISELSVFSFFDLTSSEHLE
jgi:hypothetical protein